MRPAVPIAVVLAAFVATAASAAAEDAPSERALACVAEHRIPSIGGVAPQIALLLREDLDAYDLDCVQTLIVGGAASPPALVREAIPAHADVDEQLLAV